MNIKTVKNCAIAIVCIGACAGGALSYANGQKEKIEDHIVYIDTAAEQSATEETSGSASADAGSTAAESEDSEKQETETAQQAVNDGKVHLNSATKSELMSLPGIGETKAEAILEYRKAYGSFKAIEEITEVKGIGDGIFAKIKDQLAL